MQHLPFAVAFFPLALVNVTLINPFFGLIDPLWKFVPLIRINVFEDVNRTMTLFVEARPPPENVNIAMLVKLARADAEFVQGEISASSAALNPLE